MENTMCYGDFAYVYDSLTDDVEYQKRADYVEKLIEKHLGRKDNLICDLGCGTGTICTLLQKRGHDCIGIDSSDSMLNVAAEKNIDNNVLYLNQDICEFELYGTVDVFLSMLDTVNYITEPCDIEKMFCLVNNYLNPDGIFIFDANTLYKFENILGDNTMISEEKGIFFTWDNFYEDELLDFELNFFVDNGDGTYRRFKENHTQRYYSPEFFIEKAKSAGLSLVGHYGDLKTNKPSQNEEREFFVFKK